MATFTQVCELYGNLSDEIKQKYPSVSEWGVRWNSRLGTCMGRAVIKKSTDEKYIELSTKIVQLNLNTPNFLSKIRDTILHEWAHALDWEKSKGWGHGPSWKKWMTTLGIPAERCYDSYDWLCKPNGKKYAIRHESGRVMSYLRSCPTPTQIDIFKRELTNITKTNLTHTLELVNLEHGWRRPL